MRNIQRQVTLNPIILGNNLNKVRNKLNQMSKPSFTFNDPITVIALQQGIGKTHMFIEYAQNHWKKQKIVLSSPRHNHLEEVYKKLDSKKARHWYGFSYQDKYGIYKGCNRLNKNIKIINNLKTSGNKNLLNPKYICDLLGCKKNKCRYYITRGKSNKIDLIPLEYLGIDAIIKQKPDIVFIDESIDKIDEYKYDASLISDCITIAQNNTYTQLVTDLKNLLPKPNKGTIKQTLLDRIYDDKNKLITDLIKNNQYPDADKINSLNSILKYLKYAPSYNSDTYYRPKIYDAFDLAYENEIKVVFLNASFNENLFTYFLETYSSTIGNVSIPKYISNIVNPQSTIIRMYPIDRFWKSAFASYNFRKTSKIIFQVLKEIEKYIPKEKIGIITYEDSGYRCGKISVEDIFLKRGYDTIHFWAEAGLNVLENKYVLVVVGTPFIPTDNIIENWEQIHDEKSKLAPSDIAGEGKEGYYIADLLVQFKINTEQQYVPLLSAHTIYDILNNWGIPIPNNTIINPWLIHKISRYHKPVNSVSYDFSLIKKQYIDQMIDSIHRNRPLTHNRMVVVFGDVLGVYPWVARLERKSLYYKDKNSVNRLLGLKQIEIDDLKTLETVLKSHSIIKENMVREFFEYVLDNEGYISKSSIARSLNVWNTKHNPDAKFIKKVQDIIQDIKTKI